MCVCVGGWGRHTIIVLPLTPKSFLLVPAEAEGVLFRENESYLFLSSTNTVLNLIMAPRHDLFQIKNYLLDVQLSIT